MNGTKSIFASKTFWAGVATALLGLLPLLGVDPGIAEPELTEKLYGAAVGVAGVVAIVGRWTARKQVAVTGEGKP